MVGNRFSGGMLSNYTEGERHILAVMSCSMSDLFYGDSIIKGHQDEIEILDWPEHMLVSPFRPSRTQERAMLNPRALPITVKIRMGSAVPLGFQALCKGSNLKVITITELISNNKNIQKYREIILHNCYITDWRFVMTSEGMVAYLTFTYDKYEHKRHAEGQNHKKKGVSATTGDQGKQEGPKKK